MKRKRMSKRIIDRREDLELVLVQTRRGGRDKGKFQVIYGHEVHGNLNWLEAAHQYGECLFHALECEAKFVE